jgi:electron transfer flavoprotein alpha subunit
MANVFAFAESRSGEVRKPGLEAVSAARTLADQTGGGEVHAMIAGGPGVAGQAERLAAAGADVVLVVEHDGLAMYNPEAVAATAAARIQAGGYRAAVFSRRRRART